MTKNERQQLILSLIKDNEIDTQDELVELLIHAGANVTQATVSRDIKDMKLIKVPGIQKKYRYMQVNYSSNNYHSKFGNIFKECVLHIQTANNLIVIKTVSGGANSAGAFIDNLNFGNLLGSIAGDDTIIGVAQSEEAAVSIANILKSYF